MIALSMMAGARSLHEASAHRQRERAGLMDIPWRHFLMWRPLPCASRMSRDAPSIAETGARDKRWL
jgi:hypothetical protein